MRGQILGASELSSDLEIEADVCIVGSGAGGAVLAASLAARGLYVVVLEEGSHYTSKEFRKLDEAWSLPNLYQERGGRATADLSITVLQGRSVGGGTTINWTTCFRTPPRVLAHWRDVHHVDTLSEETLAPHFEAIEARLGIERWEAAAPNANNGTLMRGATALGWEALRTRRNVRGCANSGYCGFGCPFDAKQAMHLTFIPDALSSGATVLSDTRALTLHTDGRRVTAVEAVRTDPGRDRTLPVRITVRAKRFAVCGGAINSPALLLRSGLGGPAVGKRTFLHPVVAMSGRYAEPILGWYGAPQSVASHAHIDRGESVGFFLEAAPIHPMLSGTSLPGFGVAKAHAIAGLSHISSLIAIHHDGMLPNDEGGTVSLRDDGRIRLDYPISPRLAEAFRDAHEVLGRVHFAAGASEISTLHKDPITLTSPDALPQLEGLRYGAHEHQIFSAHQMGGCAMGPDPETSVVDTRLAVHGTDNLWVVDGSVLPTGLGVNPSETIYGIAHWAAEHVADG